MLAVTAFGIALYIVALTITSAETNYVFKDTWGQAYCRPSFCGLLDQEGWFKCCERYKKCCAYAELAIGGFRDPFSFEKEKPFLLPTARPVPTPVPTLTPSPTKAEEITEDLGGPIEVLATSSPEAPGHLQAGRPANLRLPSRDQVKPVTLEDNSRWNSGYFPNKPSKNDVTYHLPPLHPDIHEMRMEEHQRESCRAKFCGVMAVSQWYNCCSRYKNCCAYVNYHSYQGDPFYFERDSQEH